MAEVKAQSGKPATRREQAAATKRKILESAQGLFAARGYAGTTMQSIADQAGVAVQTVYFVFHTKGGLLRQLLMLVGGGPDASVETMERPWVHEAMSASDGRRTVGLMVEHGFDIYARVAPVMEAIGEGASVDPEVAEVWDGIVDERRLGILEIVEALSARGHLRHGLTVDRATDIVYGFHRPETYAVFVGERSWPVEDFKFWFYELLCQQLLSPDASGDEDPIEGLSFGGPPS